jgi:hypothetical protein
VTSSTRPMVWSPPKDSTFEVRREGPLAGLLPFSSRHIPETPPMQLPFAQGKLVSGPQPGAVRRRPLAGVGVAQTAVSASDYTPLGLHDLEALSVTGQTHMIAASAPFASCGLT